MQIWTQTLSKVKRAWKQHKIMNSVKFTHNATNTNKIGDKEQGTTISSNAIIDNYNCISPSISSLNFDIDGKVTVSKDFVEESSYLKLGPEI